MRIMEEPFVIYSAFRDTNDYRIYYDIVLSTRGIYLIEIGRLPRIYKKQPATARGIDVQILRLRKERARALYKDLDRLSRLREVTFIDNESIVGITLEEKEIPLPPILRKPPRPGEEPKYTERVLCIKIYTSKNREPIVLYTALKLKDMLKKVLRNLGLYLDHETARK